MENMRKLLRRYLKNTVIRRKLPTDFHSTPLYVTPASQLHHLKFGSKSFDNELLQIALTHINETSRVWDIGANVGVFTFAAASLAKRGAVLAVEADIWLADMIRKSKQIKQNRSLNIMLLSAAISNQYGVGQFWISNLGRASSGLALSSRTLLTENVLDEVWVPTVTLDSLLSILDKPEFVKIDVEGAESLVLEGGKTVLSEIRPIIYIEVGQAANSAVTALLQDYEYELFQTTSQGLEPISVCTCSTLAIPK